MMITTAPGNRDHEVVVTGLGARCSLGRDVRELDTALRAGSVGITWEPPAAGLPREAGLRSRIPTGFNGQDRLAAPEALRRLSKRGAPALGHALSVALEAWERAGLAIDGEGRRRGMALAVDGCGAESSRTAARKFDSSPGYVPASRIQHYWASYTLSRTSELLGLGGEGIVVGGASATGNLALLQGSRMIQSGAADICLVLAPVQEMSDIELAAFANAGALGGKGGGSPERASRPFDRTHDGFIFGEVAAAVVLESAGHAESRGVRGLAAVAGGAVVMDRTYTTRPDPAGESDCMQSALERAGCAVTDVDLVSAHATSTPIGDQTEAAALLDVFGGSAPGPRINALKSMVGHGLASAGLLQAVAGVLQIHGDFVHATPGLDAPISTELNLSTDAVMGTRVDVVLSNAFAFGGINSSVVLRKPSGSARGHGVHVSPQSPS